jgi:hypothetical protein
MVRLCLCTHDKTRGKKTGNRCQAALDRINAARQRVSIMSKPEAPPARARAAEAASRAAAESKERLRVRGVVWVCLFGCPRLFVNLGSLFQSVAAVKRGPCKKLKNVGKQHEEEDPKRTPWNSKLTALPSFFFFFLPKVENAETRSKRATFPPQWRPLRRRLQRRRKLRSKRGFG